MAEIDEVEWIPFKEAAQRVGGNLKRTERAITDRAKNGRKEDGSPLIRTQREIDGKKRWLVAWEDVEKWAENYDTEVANVLPIPVSVMEKLDDLNERLLKESNERAALERIEPFLREQVREKTAAVKFLEEEKSRLAQECATVQAERDDLERQLAESNRPNWLSRLFQGQN